MSVPEPPRPKWQRRLITVVVVGSLAILLGVVGGTVLVRGGAGPGSPQDSPSPSPTGPPTPADTVRRYLEALAAGNAEAARAEAASQPADVSMLTDEVLTAALAETPITELNVPPLTDVEPEDETARVPVSYLIGEERVNESVDVTRSGGSWKVTETAVEVDLSSVRSENVPLLVNGTEIKADSVTVFPGRYEITSDLDHIDYGEDPVIFISSASDSVSTAGIEPALSTAGAKAFTDAIDAELDACVATKELAPKGCPFEYKLGYQEKIKAKTITWSLASEPEIDPFLDSNDQSMAKVSFDLEVELAADGTKNGDKNTFEETVSSYVTVMADMTTSTVKLAWS